MSAALATAMREGGPTEAEPKDAPHAFAQASTARVSPLIMWLATCAREMHTASVA